MAFSLQTSVRKLSRMKPKMRDFYLLVFVLMLLLIAKMSLFGKETPAFFTVPAEVRPSTSTTSPRQNKTILLWTKFFGVENYIQPLKTQGCPESRCVITSDRSLLSKSDAIVFHLRDTNANDLPSTRFPWQRWVLINHESPPNSPQEPLLKLDGKINWTITYRLDSDILLTPLPHRIARTSQNTTTKDYSRNKTSMAVWFVSNCHTPSNREAFVAQLRKTISVDIYGTCGPKKCEPKMSNECYQDASRRYRFYLSFENSLCKDYVTEKLYHVFGYDMVPVVFGGADYKLVAPPGSYVNALDFQSPRALGQHLLSLAKSPENYNKLFQWKNEYELRIGHYACKLCEKLHSADEPYKTWTNLYKWWFDQADCRRWPSK